MPPTRNTELEPNVALPAGIAAAWGVREHPTKGPKRGLTLAGIVEAAVRVAARDGLSTVSMARVAGEIGASTMSLYRYVSSKDELLTLMADAAYGDHPDLDPTTLGWRGGLRAFATAEREAIRRNPWVVLIPIGGAPPVGPHQIGWLEWGLATMGDTELTPHEKLETLLMITMFTRSESLLGIQMATAQRDAGVTDEQAMTAYHGMLKQLLDPARYPEMNAVLDSGAFGPDADNDPDYEFTFGLDRILDGVEVLINRRSSSL